MEPMATPQPKPSFPIEQELKRADAYLASGLISEAHEMYEHILEQSNDVRAHMGASECAHRRRNLHEALSHMQAVAEVDPNYPDLANNMGVVLFEMGLTKLAKEYFEKAAYQDPYNALPWRNLVDVALKTEDKDNCIRACKRVIELEPEDVEIRAILEQLEPDNKITTKSTTNTTTNTTANVTTRPASMEAKPVSGWYDEPKKSEKKTETTATANSATSAKPMNTPTAPRVNAPITKTNFVAASSNTPSSAKSMATATGNAATSNAATSKGVTGNAATSTTKEIWGVKSASLEAQMDETGYEMEVLRADDEFFTKFGSMKMMGQHQAGMVRGFSKHELGWNWFFICQGCAKFVLKDDRPSSPTYGQIQTIIAGERNPCCICVPPGVYYGWKSLAEKTQMMATGSEMSVSDETHIDANSFGNVW